MSYLSMMEARLPPGFRFHPRDEELVCDYLEKKILSGNSGTLNGCPTVIDVDLNKCEPWDLPEVACVGGKEWYFFSLRDRKYATGQRTNRATVSGYWKATGKDRQITRKGQLVGMRKTLVFYEGRAPKGRKTDWVMHEFRREACDDISSFSIKEDWVLCRVFYKSRGHSSSKPSMDTSYEDKTSCSSLPTLMETYINFGPQKSALVLEGYEQVPCFSNFHPNSMRAPMMGPPANSSSRPVKSPTHLGDLPDLGSGLGQLNQLDCDKEVIRAVINHLTKLEGDQKSSDPPSSLGEGSIDSYLCENGLSPVW